MEEKKTVPALRENAVTTLDALKTFLGIPLDDADEQRDAALVQLINAASAWLETTLGRKLGKQDYHERKIASGTQRLVMEQWPIRSISKIIDTTNGAEITGYDFGDQGEIGVVFREDGWTYRGHIGGLSMDYVAPRRYLLVDYTAGYILPKDATDEEPSDFPADLEALVWNMLRWRVSAPDIFGAGPLD